MASLRRQFGQDLVAVCEDESTLFFTFKEQLDQGLKFLSLQDTLLVQEFDTETEGLKLTLFIGQAATTFNFYLMGACLNLGTDDRGKMF